MNEYSFSYWLTNPELNLKLKFLFTYFNQALKEIETRNITFYKENLPSNPIEIIEFLTQAGINNSDKFCMSTLTIEEAKKIEDYEGADAIMADFANEFIGGGAASFGNVQEEILFAIYPELFVSQLFLERMDPHEAIYLKGARKYSDYSGYGGSLDYKKLDASKRSNILDSKARL